MSNNKSVVDNMIGFIEQKEREFQASKLTESQGKTDVVKSILDELEREIKNENQQN